MTAFAIELQDRALCLARDGQVLSCAPSAVFDGTPSGPATGTNAWRELRSRPMSTSSRHLGAVLAQRAVSARAESLLTAELRARLAEQRVSDGERVWVVVPARFEPKGLEAVLGIARRLPLAVDGFIDSAVAEVASLDSARNAIVLELGLHHLAATAVDVEGGQARRRRSVLTERGGYIELHQTWLELISTTMVRRTRFDPLHDAATEQQLFDALPTLTREATGAGVATAVVTKGQERFEIALTRDQFAQAAEPIYRSIIALLHQLRPAGASVDIVVPAIVGELPGLRPMLEEFVGCELVSTPDGSAAAAVSLLELPERPPEQDAVRLLRRIPLKAAAAGATREALGQRRSGGPAPSHVLFDGRAYSLTADALVVGRAPEPASTRPVITLPDGLAGVSRRHCTFVHDGNELVLLDHSTFGTFVNGERVQERVRIHAGDRVRLGEPGVELALIAVGEVPATIHPPV
jgi:hypothetical protein